MKTKIIPFDLETAKKIQAGEIEGAIKTKGGDTLHPISILRLDISNYKGNSIIMLEFQPSSYESVSFPSLYYSTGESCMISMTNEYDLVLDVIDEPQFKPFDKVLVRDSDDELWIPRLFEIYSRATEKYYCQDCGGYLQCVPYEGHEYLVCTTNKPKEE